MMQRRAILVSVVVFFWAASTGPRLQAWGNDGHKIVCAIAYKLLSAADRKQVDSLASVFRDPDGGQYSFMPGCLFPDIARRRSSPKLDDDWKPFVTYDRWHFLNVPRTTTVIDADTCANCVLHGITFHKDRLRNTSLPPADRGEALLFLGHWVGDLHQPLHISYENDEGGNKIAPVTGYGPFEGTLHAVWDTGIPRKARGKSDWWSFAGNLRAKITPQLQQQWSAIPMKAWAQESYDITIQAETLYCKHVKDRCAAITPNGRDLTDAYQKTFGSVVELRLQKAGARLATLIQQALHP